MAAVAHSRAPPPSAQEIQRKLSTSRPPKPSNPLAPLSGTESDSDSVFSPDASSPPGPAYPLTSGLFSPPSQAPLSAIAERRTISGEETDEEEEADEGWRPAAASAQMVTTLGSQPHAPESESVRKAGYLSKKGERRKAWKKRWFVLRLPYLAYYKSSAEYKLLRLLDLHDVHAVTPCELKRHTNTFGVVSPNRTFYLQADTEESMLSWVQELNDARIALQNTLTVHSVQTVSGPSVPHPIQIPAPTTPRRGTACTMPSPITPSPPRQLHTHNVASSDSDEPSPTAVHASVPLSGTISRNNASAAGQDPSKVVLSGYLMKCASKRRSWRKRWFTLTGEKLVYSGSHMDTRPHRSILLPEILDALEFTLPAGRHNQLPVTSSPPAQANAGSSEEQEKTHTFKVVTPKRTLVLCAPSEEEEIKWLSAIRAVIARRSGSLQAPAEVVRRKDGGDAAPLGEV